MTAGSAEKWKQYEARNCADSGVDLWGALCSNSVALASVKEGTEQSLNNSLPNTTYQQVLIRATSTKNPESDDLSLPVNRRLLVRVQPEDQECETCRGRALTPPGSRAAR